MDRRIAELERTLARRPAARAPAGAEPAARDAAVALVVRPAPADLEILLIRRAERAGDPWSGHVALPGGRRHAEDADLLATAVRETWEEVGIDLAGAGRLLGALDEVAPRAAPVPVRIAPFVFAVGADAAPVPNHEVAEAAWVGVDELLHPDAAAEHRHPVPGGEPLAFPAYGVREYVVWGLTYRILSQFLGLYETLMRAERNR